MRALLLSFVLLFVTVHARAETRRVAVIVGNNAGVAERSPLRFAEVDAGKMARTLIELGNVAPEDLFLLQGRTLAALRSALEQAQRKVTEWHGAHHERVVLIFYFSGHSDGESLEIGAERLPYADLRKWLSSTGAEVRVGIVDSCKSGALIAFKGATATAPFQIRISDQLNASGEALITSSAANEAALESKEIGGSFFTHHFVSGLRGAADASGDGLVTLGEAYQYAFSHTVTATADTLAGVQHPGYDYRLSGQGELVLSELSHPTASIELPRSYDRVLLIQTRTDQVIAELTPGSARLIALPAGEYVVSAWERGQHFSGRVRVAEGETRRVTREELSHVSVERAKSKGESDRPRFVATARGRATIALASIGAGALVASAVTGGIALSSRNDYRASCAATCRDGLYERAHDTAIATDVLWAVSGGAILSSVILLATRPRDHQLAVTPTFAPSAAALAISGEF